MKNKIKTFINPNDWMPIKIKGYGNGYIGVPPEHPWFNKNYKDLNAVVIVHGGLTYSENCAPRHKPDGLWWIGFDTMHRKDTQETCPLAYVESEVDSLKQQAIKAYDRQC